VKALSFKLIHSACRYAGVYLNREIEAETDEFAVK